MNPKKLTERKSRSAGISLEPDIIRDGRALATRRGLNSLSALVRTLVVRELNQAADKAERASESIKTKCQQIKSRKNK